MKRYKIKQQEVKTHRAEIPLTYREKISFLCRRYEIPAPTASAILRIFNLLGEASHQDLEKFCEQIEKEGDPKCLLG